MSPPPQKRRRVSDDEESHEDEDEDMGSASDGSAGSEGSNEDEDEEIVNLRPPKSEQTKKRKIRATAPDKFGLTLQSLLNTDAPSELPLSLKPSLARKRNDEKLEVKAKKALAAEKKEKEEKGRVSDIIGGWGAESERGLRKVAQRGGTSCYS